LKKFDIFCCFLVLSFELIYKGEYSRKIIKIRKGETIMKKFTKTLVCILLTFMLLSISPIAIFAALPQDNMVEPQWIGIADIGVDINFNETLGRATGITRKHSTASKIEATLSVYKQVGDDDWEFLNSGYGEKSVGTLLISVDFTPEVNATYKAVFEVTAYTNNIPETETIERIVTNN
jgi:hypothetical protein